METVVIMASPTVENGAARAQLGEAAGPTATGICCL